METKKQNNKGLMIAVIVIVVFLGGAFYLAKNDSSSGQADNSKENEETTQTTQPQISKAGELGPNELKIDDQNFKEKVEDAKGIVLVDFYLSTCPHCQNVAKAVTEASDSLVSKAKVGKIDAAANSASSEKYSIESVPTFIVFKDGKEVERAVGEKTKEELIALVNKYL